MFISVNSLSLSLNGSQIVGLHYDDILRLGVLVVGSDADEHRYGIKGLKGNPGLLHTASEAVELTFSPLAESLISDERQLLA